MANHNSGSGHLGAAVAGAGDAELNNWAELNNRARPPGRGGGAGRASRLLELTRSPAQLPAPRRSTPSPLNTGAPPEGLDLVVLAIESSRGLPAIDDGSSSPLPESPRKKRKEPEQASSLPAAADVTSSVETLRERSPSDDQKPPGEEASVITPPPQAAKTAWPEESKAAVQKTLNPSPDNSVDGAGQPVSPV